jgi:hypothetical protein
MINTLGKSPISKRINHHKSLFNFRFSSETTAPVGGSMSAGFSGNQGNMGGHCLVRQVDRCEVGAALYRVFRKVNQRFCRHSPVVVTRGFRFILLNGSHARVLEQSGNGGHTRSQLRHG